MLWTQHELQLFGLADDIDELMNVWLGRGLKLWSARHLENIERVPTAGKYVCTTLFIGVTSRVEKRILGNGQATTHHKKTNTRPFCDHRRARTLALPLPRQL